MPTLQVPGMGTVIPSLGQRASFRVSSMNVRPGFHPVSSVSTAKRFHLSLLICKAEVVTQASEAHCGDLHGPPFMEWVVCLQCP